MEKKYYTMEEIKNMLPQYYDLPSMISAEFIAIRDIAASRSDFSVLAAQKWAEEEAKCHMKRAQELATQHRFLQNALPKLDSREKMILQLRFMGPAALDRRRKGFTIPPWKVVCQAVSLSSSQARALMRKSIKWLSELPVEQVTFDQAE